MIGDGVEVVEFVHAISHGVGERVLLGVERTGLDTGDGLGQIATHRDGAQEFECPRLHLARQHADAHPLEVSGHTHAPHAV